MVWRPETSVLVSDDCVMAFSVPGTPHRQVGEIQCHVMRTVDGAQVGSLLEVVELDPGRRAVTVSLSDPQARPSVTEVLSIDDRSAVLRFTLTAVVPSSDEQQVRQVLQGFGDTYVARIRDLMQAAAPDS